MIVQDLVKLSPPSLYVTSSPVIRVAIGHWHHDFLLWVCDQTVNDPRSARFISASRESFVSVGSVDRSGR